MNSGSAKSVSSVSESSASKSSGQVSSGGSAGGGSSSGGPGSSVPITDYGNLVADGFEMGDLGVHYQVHNLNAPGTEAIGARHIIQIAVGPEWENITTSFDSAHDPGTTLDYFAPLDVDIPPGETLYWQVQVYAINPETGGISFPEGLYLAGEGSGFIYP